MGNDSEPETHATGTVTAPMDTGEHTYNIVAEETLMYQKIIRNTTVALGTLLVSSSLVLAAGFQGVVTGVDSKGMATVRASDNKDHQVRVGDGLKLNDLKVQCETTKNNAL